MQIAAPNSARPRHIRVPAFLPVPLRARSDGWTPLRQAQFLVALARTRSVKKAALAAGKTRETAYRLRSRRGAESFAAAWDAELGVAAKRKVTPEERMRRAFDELVRPLVRGGECVGLARKPDNSALLSLIAQLDRSDRYAP
jgi:hypothetical protein